jgi:hypothetical protein
MSQRMWSRPMLAGAVGAIMVALFWCCALLAEEDDGERMDGPEAYNLVGEPEAPDGRLESGSAEGLWDEAEPAPGAQERAPASSIDDGRPGLPSPGPGRSGEDGEAAPTVPEGSDDSIPLPPRKGVDRPPSVVSDKQTPAAVAPPTVQPRPPVASEPSAAPLGASEALETPGVRAHEADPVGADSAATESLSAAVELPPRVESSQASPTETSKSLPAEPVPGARPRGVDETSVLPPVLPPPVGDESSRQAPPQEGRVQDRPPVAGLPTMFERLDPWEQWRQARRAFWTGRFDESVAAYRALIEVDPGNWLAHGELGNVLYRQGKWDAAVEALYDAAVLLWESGRREDAQHLARIVGNLQPGRGQDLARIFSGRGHDDPESSSYSRLLKSTESQ